MNRLTKVIATSLFIIGAGVSQFADARTLLGQVYANSQGKIEGTVINQGTKLVRTDAAGFPAALSPKDIVNYAIEQPAPDTTLQVKYISDTGNGCIFFFETKKLGDKNITYIYAEGLSIYSYCHNTGSQGSHLGVAADIREK